MRGPAVSMKRSAMRLRYLFRFVFRAAVFAGVVLLYLLRPASFAVAEAGGFFQRPGWLHLLWLIWLADMAAQLLPVRGLVALGAQKYRAGRYLPSSPPPRGEELLAYIRRADRGARKVLAAWALAAAVLGLARILGLVGAAELLLCSVFFYVCDLICVLFWCPFRAWMMHNRCCADCRIFNWDHLMMFTPLAFAPSFYSWSLLLPATAIVLLWEFSFRLHPERFWPGSNAALRCGNCTERLCGRSYRALKKDSVSSSTRSGAPGIERR